MTLMEWVEEGHTLPQDIAVEFMTAIGNSTYTVEGVNSAFIRRYSLRGILDTEDIGVSFTDLIEGAAQAGGADLAYRVGALSDSSEDGESYYPAKTTTTQLRTPQSAGEYRDGAVETVAELTGATPGDIITRRKSSTTYGDRRKELTGTLNDYLSTFESCFKGAIAGL